MKTIAFELIGIFLLATWCSAASTHRNDNTRSFHQHKREDSDLDFVQCHHSVYRFNQNSGKPELTTGQESRVEPSRQYLPQGSIPNPSRQYLPQPLPKDEEAPAASFDQPKVLTVENTFVSPTLQKNFNSLFGSKTKSDEIAPAAAQEAPTNALAPPSPKKSNSKHSDEDDENNLERLCNDAFHSFLCKPIKGPRKTPTGRLRANAVVPPDVLAGFASFQETTRVKPEPPKSPSPSNNVGYSLKPSNLVNSVDSEIPSPTYNNPQVIKPQPPKDISLKPAAQTTGYFYEKPAVPFPPQITDPSNQNLIYQRPTFPPTTRPTTPRPAPTNGYFYDKPSIPFPSNNVPQIAQPPKPAFQPPIKHDCDKPATLPVVANPSNLNQAFLKPITPSTSRPFKTYNQKPEFSLASNFIPKSTQPPVLRTTQSHDCDKHPFSPIVGNPSNQNTFAIKPYIKPTQKSFFQTEKPKIPSASNNIPQIIAQPQQINSFTVAPQKSSGYFYEKPSIPFPPPSIISTTQKPTQRPFTFQTTARPTTGYVYEQPRIPFPSNNIAQIISQPATQKLASTTTAKPCEHDKPKFSSFPIASNPTNQNSVILKPSSTFNSFQSSNPPFSRGNTISASPANNGYTYEKPERPFPPQENLPSNNNQFITNIPTSTSKPSSGYSYDVPNIPFPSNTNSNFARLPNQNQSKYIARPQTQVEVTVRPGYSYNKPSKPFVPSQSINTGADGYSYPRPSSLFSR